MTILWAVVTSKIAVVLCSDLRVFYLIQVFFFECCFCSELKKIEVIVFIYVTNIWKNAFIPGTEHYMAH